MTDHIPPIDIQGEIMKKLPVKSLIRFRSVSKPWKSLIESSIFINNYHINHTQPQHHLFVQYMFNDEHKYISIRDDNTFPNQKSSLTVSGLVSLLRDAVAISSVNGLLCFYGVRRDVAREAKMAVLWNPTIRKSVGIPIPDTLRPRIGSTYISFWVCPTTSDLKIVKINTIGCETVGYKAVDWEVEVYTLSARVWKTISNIPPAIRSCDLSPLQVFVGGFIYWCVFDDVRLYHNRSNLIVSFDLKSDEFGEVCLPDRLAHTYTLKIAKVHESLGLLEFDRDQILRCGVWVMKEGVTKLFTKMFSIKSPPDALWGEYSVSELRNNGDAIIEYIYKRNRLKAKSRLEVYEPCSGHIYDIGIIGKSDMFSVKSYMETLLLLDHPDSILH